MARSRRWGEVVRRARQPDASVVSGSPPASAIARTHGLLGLRIGRCIELDQGELDLDMGHRIEVLDLEHVDHALQLREHLAQVPVVPADGDRHPRTSRLVGRADRQRLDVEAARAQQARDAVERAGTIDDEGAHHVPSLDGIGLAGRNRGRARRANASFGSALDHVRQALAGQHHRVDVLLLVQVEVDQRRAWRRARSGDDAVDLVDLRGPPGGMP